MNIEAYTEEKILDDILYLKSLYKLKSVIRSNLEREEDDLSESVAEHIYSLHILALYFLPLEDPESTLDKELIFQLITTHDLEETVTGDVVGWEKTSEDKSREALAKNKILESTPEHMKDCLRKLFNIYDGQLTREAQFVKAIDKLDPHIHFFDTKYKKVFEQNQITAEKAMSIKEPYLKKFPFINKCNQTIHKQMLEQDFYFRESY